MWHGSRVVRPDRWVANTRCQFRALYLSQSSDAAVRLVAIAARAANERAPAALCSAIGAVLTSALNRRTLRRTESLGTKHGGAVGGR